MSLLLQLFSESLKMPGSAARAALPELFSEGLIKVPSKHRAPVIYTRTQRVEVPQLLAKMPDRFHQLYFWRNKTSLNQTGKRKEQLDLEKSALGRIVRPRKILCDLSLSCSECVPPAMTSGWLAAAVESPFEKRMRLSEGRTCHYFTGPVWFEEMFLGGIWGLGK